MQEQDESLILHLEALRTMLIKCFVALGSVCSRCFSPPLTA